MLFTLNVILKKVHRPPHLGSQRGLWHEKNEDLCIRFHLQKYKDHVCFTHHHNLTIYKSTCYIEGA